MNNDIKICEIFSLLSDIKKEISQKIDQVFSKKKQNLVIDIKPDKSIVTDVDLFISKIFKEKFTTLYPFLNYFSEEDQGSFNYPMIIIDPIDGTRELAKNIDECAVSFGIYFSENLNDCRNFSWIYNPFTGFEISSDFIKPFSIQRSKDQFLSLVSSSEYDEGLYQSNEKIIYAPKGSIANKLGLLAAGAGDFIISKKPKNIWDIIAGTHICYVRDIFLFQNRIQLEKLVEIQIENDLVWSSLNYWKKLQKLI